MTQLGLSFDAPPPRQERAGSLRSFHCAGQPIGVDEALNREKKAERQEDLIIEWFRYQRAGARFTPSAVHAVFVSRGWPLTSIRRALTNMTSRELLNHHPADRRPGPLGSLESTWSLKRPCPTM